MKNKNFSALLGGLLATTLAMAASPDYTLLTSSNLTDSGSYDSGFYTANSANWLGQTNSITQTTASILGTHQDIAGNWFQTTQYTAVSSYDVTYQDFTNTQRYLNFNFSVSGVGDQWVDLSLSTTGPMNYSVYAYGTYGSKTSPRGFTQTISPALGVIVDGASATASNQNWGNMNWYAYKNASVGNTFQAVVEATDGGSISQLYVNFSSEQVLGAIRTEHVSYQSNQWIQDVAISAPPVPEPEGWAMMLAGLGLMGFIAKRRRGAKY